MYFLIRLQSSGAQLAISIDKLRIVLQAGYDTLDKYIWGNYSHFIDDYNDFYDSIKERSETYIQVLLFEYGIIETYFYFM